MIYNQKLNNEDRLNHYIQKLDHFNFNSHPAKEIEIHEVDFVTEFLEEITAKPEENSKILSKLKDIFSRAPRSLFSETYNEKIGKIIE